MLHPPGVGVREEHPVRPNNVWVALLGRTKKENTKANNYKDETHIPKSNKHNKHILKCKIIRKQHSKHKTHKKHIFKKRIQNKHKSNINSTQAQTKQNNNKK